MLCTVERCDREAEVKGLCRVCYSNERQKAKRLAEKPTLVCSHCGEEYLSERYHQGTRNKFCSRKCKQDSYNHRPGKKEDTLRRYYLRRYGLTLAEVETMKAAGCAICGRTDVAGRWANNLHIDHDHDTGKVRGVLCHGCNVSLGHFRHDPELLRKAIVYLG